jgi:hypothetical protein
MIRVAFAAVLAGFPSSQAAPMPQPDAKLVRVFLQTDDQGEPKELAARRESLKHLSEALASRKKTLALVSDEDHADVVIEVEGRGLIVPRIVIGTAPRPGDPPGAVTMARVVQLTVAVNAERISERESFKNKNSPVESQIGWKSAADDIAKQIDKWIADRRVALLAAREAGPAPAQGRDVASSEYLYAWTGSADSTQPDFLAVFDVRPESGRYGRLVTTVPVPGGNHGPHHTEHEMPADLRLFANGYRSDQTFIFDLTDPARPRIDGQFGEMASLMHPHSFLRRPNGNLLATFQMQHDSVGTAPGGLAELTPRGALVRSTSANTRGVDRRIRPYSAAIVPTLDRVVTTTTNMAPDRDLTQAVQIWRLSAWSAVVCLDISNPAAPREVSRVTLGAGDVPHWIAIEPNRRRVVITGYATLQHRIMMARFSADTGQLALDEGFRDEGASTPGVRLDNKTWPHGGTGAGIPHGAVFSRVRGAVLAPR